MEIEDIQKLENATSFGWKEMFRYGSALLFIVGIMLFSSSVLPEGQSVSIELVIAVGGVFGVGFLREYLKANYAKTIHEFEQHHNGGDKSEVEAFMGAFKSGTIEDKRRMLAEIKQHTTKAEFTKKERKGLKKVYRQELVKRSALLKIAAAWLITVPAAGNMAALLFFTIRGMMLP